LVSTSLLTWSAVGFLTRLDRRAVLPLNPRQAHHDRRPHSHDLGTELVGQRYQAHVHALAHPQRRLGSRLILTPDPSGLSGPGAQRLAERRWGGQLRPRRSLARLRTLGSPCNLDDPPPRSDR
jgi:hypothetical protein